MPQKLNIFVAEYLKSDLATDLDIDRQPSDIALEHIPFKDGVSGSNPERITKRLKIRLKTIDSLSDKGRLSLFCVKMCSPICRRKFGYKYPIF